MTIYSIYTSATDCNYEQPHFYFKSHDLCLPSYTFSNISIIYFSLVRKTKRDTVDLPTVVGWSGADNLPYEKVGKNEPVCIADEVPFEIPESWEWVRIGSLFSLQAGKNISASKINELEFPDSYPCYGGNGIRGYVNVQNHNGDYPIIGRQGALCGNIKRATGKFYATEHAVCVSTFAHTDITWVCFF